MRKPSDLTQEELELLYSDWQDGEKSLRQIAESFDLNPSTLPGVFQKAGITRAKAPVSVHLWSPDDYTLQAVHEKEVLQLKAQVKHVTSLYRAAVGQTTIREALVEAMGDAITAWPAPSLDIQPVTRRKSGIHTMVALLSDLHVGEVVDPEAMMGMGGYDMEIFRQRAGLWVKNFLRLLDIVSGIIHDELLKTNAANIMDQTVMVAVVMAWAIREVGRYFEEVHVSCTPGNHGRTTQKMEFKDPSLSWDYIAYQMMAMLLKEDTHITWDISKSLWAITRVENLDLFHYHGHGKIQNTLSIPYYGIERAVREFREIFQIHDLGFDGICMGHYHHYFERDLGTGPIIINPCWKGGDEFATLGLRKHSKPAQVRFLVHHSRGYVGSQMIHLWDQKPSDAEGVPEGASGIWARTNF